MTVGPQADDRKTVAALGVLAWIATDLAHEVFGHGAGLLLAGGRSGVFTVTRLIYNQPLPGPAWRVFDLGGPGGNLLWAAFCFAVLKRLTGARPALRLFLWSGLCFSLLWETGYLVKCAVTGTGDPMAILPDSAPAWFWRPLFFLGGTALYRAALRLLAAHFEPLRTRVLPTLCVAAGLAAVAGPLRDPRGAIEMLNSGVLSSFASWPGLIFLPGLVAEASRAQEPARVATVVPVMVLAVVSLAAYAGLLGPGLHFSL